MNKTSLRLDRGFLLGPPGKGERGGQEEDQGDIASRGEEGVTWEE